MSTILNPYRYAAGGGGGGRPDHNWEIIFDATVGVYNTGTTDATDGQTVATWADQSANGNDATQAAEANKPVFDSSAFGGVGGVESVSADSLNLTTTIPWSDTGGYTFFAVVNRPTASSIVCPLGGGGTGNYIGLWFSDDKIYSSKAWGTDRYFDTDTINESGDHIITTQNSSSTVLNAWYDAVDKNAVDTGAATLTANLVTLFQSGGIGTTGTLGEVLYTTDILTSGEIDAVESYLADKWGITI